MRPDHYTLLDKKETFQNLKLGIKNHIQDNLSTVQDYIYGSYKWGSQLCCLFESFKFVEAADVETLNFPVITYYHLPPNFLIGDLRLEYLS